MQVTRHWPTAACLALLAAALFAGGAASTGPLAWIGVAALAVILVLLAVRGVPGGSLRLIPLAAIAAWCAASIGWSTLPDASWDYADRALVYLLFAILGLWLAGRTRELAVGLAGLFGAVAAWALLLKAVPSLHGYESPVARLRDPVGLWNQLALVGDFALPLALWAACRRRVAGTILAFVWLVALVLTLSRGGLLVAVLVVAASLLLSDDAVDGFMTMVAAGLPAAVVVAIAFALPGVTSDGQSAQARSHDGRLFGVALVAGLLAAVALTRLPRPSPGAAFRKAALVAGGLAAVLVAVAVALTAGAAWREFTSSNAVGNSSGRFGSAGSNFRWVWWQQAWRGFTHHLLDGTGAGTFALTNKLYRTSSVDVTTEPHNLPVQFLSELGIAGGVLLALTALFLLRGSLRRQGHELALALILPAYLLHALVDIDWDYVAVSAPAFLVAGALVGRAGSERRVSFFAVLAASGAALAAFGVLLMPWLGHRWSGQAQDAVYAYKPAEAIKLAKRARAVDPLLVDPFFTLALAAEEQHKPNLAYAYFRESTRKQPANPATWESAGLYAFGVGCMRKAYDNLVHSTALDPYGEAVDGGIAYNQALNIVNAGQARC